MIGDQSLVIGDQSFGDRGSMFWQSPINILGIGDQNFGDQG